MITRVKYERDVPMEFNTLRSFSEKEETVADIVLRVTYKIPKSCSEWYIGILMQSKMVSPALSFIRTK